MYIYLYRVDAIFNNIEVTNTKANVTLENFYNSKLLALTFLIIISIIISLLPCSLKFIRGNNGYAFHSKYDRHHTG